MLSCSRLFVCAIFESTVSRQKENFVCSAESPTRLGNAWKIIFFKMAPTKIEFVESTMLSGLVSSHTWSPFVLRRLQDSGKMEFDNQTWILWHVREILRECSDHSCSVT